MKKNFSYHFKHIFICCALLLLGFISYVLFRNNFPLEYYPVSFFRPIHYFAAFNLADGLWMAALTYSIVYIWQFKMIKSMWFWYGIALLAGICFECFQHSRINWAPGTFDYRDIFVIAIGGLIPILILKK